MVLYVGRHDLVSFMPRKTARYGIYALSGVLCHDDFFGLSVDEVSDLAAGILVLFSGLLGESMDSPLDVRPVLVVKLQHLLENWLRSQAGCSVIEIGDACQENGKILSDSIHVHVDESSTLVSV